MCSGMTEIRMAKSPTINSLIFVLNNILGKWLFKDFIRRVPTVEEEKG